MLKIMNARSLHVCDVNKTFSWAELPGAGVKSVSDMTRLVCKYTDTDIKVDVAPAPGTLRHR